LAKLKANLFQLETLICNYARNYTDEEEPAGSNEGGEGNVDNLLNNRMDEESNSTANGGLKFINSFPKY
jgi:hypothetical protein